MPPEQDPTAASQAEAVLHQLREELRRSAADTPPPFAAPVETPTTRTAVDRLLDHVAELQDRWQIIPAAPSSARPVLGRIINRVVLPVYGRILRVLAWPVLQPQMSFNAAQNNFNAAVVRYAQHAYQMIRILQDEARYLRQETREYDHHAATATHRLAQLELATQRLAEQLAGLQTTSARLSADELSTRLTEMERELRALQPPATALAGEAGGAAPE